MIHAPIYISTHGTKNINITLIVYYKVKMIIILNIYIVSYKSSYLIFNNF